MAGNARPTAATGLSAAAGSRTGVVTSPDWQACCGNRTNSVEYWPNITITDLDFYLTSLDPRLQEKTGSEAAEGGGWGDIGAVLSKVVPTAVSCCRQYRG